MSCAWLQLWRAGGRRKTRRFSVTSVMSTLSGSATREIDLSVAEMEPVTGGCPYGYDPYPDSPVTHRPFQCCHGLNRHSPKGERLIADVLGVALEQN